MNRKVVMWIITLVLILGIILFFLSGTQIFFSPDYASVTRDTVLRDVYTEVRLDISSNSGVIALRENLPPGCPVRRYYGSEGYDVLVYNSEDQTFVIMDSESPIDGQLYYETGANCLISEGGFSLDGEEWADVVQGEVLDERSTNSSDPGNPAGRETWCGGSDLNKDGVVDGGDLEIFNRYYLSANNYCVTVSLGYQEECAVADINRDTWVDDADNQTLYENLGRGGCIGERGCIGESSQCVSDSSGPGGFCTGNIADRRCEQFSPDMDNYDPDWGLACRTIGEKLTDPWTPDEPDCFEMCFGDRWQIPCSEIQDSIESSGGNPESCAWLTNNICYWDSETESCGGVIDSCYDITYTPENLCIADGCSPACVGEIKKCGNIVHENDCARAYGCSWECEKVSCASFNSEQSGWLLCGLTEGCLWEG